MRYFRNPDFSCFGKKPTCDGQTDRQTDDHSICRAST